MPPPQRNLTPLIGPADAAIIGLEMAGTIEELTAALDVARGAVDDIANETTTALACT